MVCYRVIVALYVRSVAHVFAYLYTPDDNSERPMDCETSLLPNVFPVLDDDSHLGDDEDEDIRVVCIPDDKFQFCIG